MGPTGTLAGLRIYPVKSAAGVAAPRAEVEPWGLRGDRRWALVDERGVRIRVRECRRIMAVTARPGPSGGIVLAAPGLPALPVAVPSGPEDKIKVELYGMDWMLAAGAAADDWVSRALGMAARLVWLDDPNRRPVSPKHGGVPGDVVNFADAGPLLLVTTASLRQLDHLIAAGAAERGEPAPEPLDPVRFRPNAILDLEEPFVEEDWRRVRIGDVPFRVAEHCDRCATPLIEPSTLESGKEPLRTLARHRKRLGRTWFGVRVVPERTGTIAIGDLVTW